MKRTLLIIAAAVICGAVMFAGKKNEEPVLPDTYVLMEAHTKAVLKENNSHTRRNAGFLSKIMALLLIAEDIDSGELSLTEKLTASQSVSGTKGAVIWLEPGDNLTVDELLKGVIIGNANDALTVLAERSAGSIEEFTDRMNARAFDLGLRDTAFYSPYGYYDDREYTTAYDMAVISAELSEHEALSPYFSVWRDFVREGKTELVSENTLTRTYSRHCGFKACHSDEAGYCISECGVNDRGNKFVAVVLGAENEDISLKTARTLVDSGFSEYRIAAAFFPDDVMRPVNVRNGEEAAVDIALRESSQITVPKGERSLRTVFVLPEYLDAPLKAGQPIGKAAFFSGRNLVFETDIIVKNDVNKLTYGYILKKIMYKMLE